MKNVIVLCEAKLSLEAQLNEQSEPSGKIEAQVTTWGAREGADGRKFNYQPEGFMDWAEAFAKEGKPLPMFLNHNDMGMPVGEWNEIQFTENGMNAKGRLYLNTVPGNDLYTVLKESPAMFGGVSVGAYAEEACMVDKEGCPLMSGDDEDEGYFQITKGGLREVSVVMYPNNPEAQVNKLECFHPDGTANVRVIEKVLREAGLSRKDATTASSILKRMLNSREVIKPNQETPNPSDADAVDTVAELSAALAMRELNKALSQRLKKESK